MERAIRKQDHVDPPPFQAITILDLGTHQNLDIELEVARNTRQWIRTARGVPGRGAFGRGAAHRGDEQTKTTSQCQTEHQSCGSSRIRDGVEAFHDGSLPA